MKKNPLILATECYEGLGFAKLAKDQGDEIIVARAMDPAEKEEDDGEWDLNGQGIAELLPLKEAVKKYGNPSYDWIFDTNHNSSVSELLRKKGVRVLGGDALSDRMEHDREYAAEVATKYGFPPPPTQKCASVDEGLKHLAANPDKSFVYKPDEDHGEKWHTFVPTASDPKIANQEVSEYLESMDEDPGSFVLQEKLQGVETNFEAWFYEGRPFFAFACLENKKKIAADPINHTDPGENTGCAQDMAFTVPLDSRGVKETIGKLFPFYRAQRHTGFVDVNAIVSDREAHFIEVCNRFGYNSHPNLFMNLSLDPFVTVVRNFLHGKTQGVPSRFRYGFGATVSLYTEHPRKGLPINVPKDVWPKFYPYQLVKADDKLFLSGYGEDVGLVAAHGYDMKSAAQAALKAVDPITYPGKSYRADLGNDDYPSSVIKRYEQMKSMHYV